MIKKELKEIVYEFISDVNVEVDEKKFLLRYLTINNDVKQKSFESLEEFDSRIKSDMSIIFECLKKTSNRMYADKVIYELTEIYDRYVRANSIDEIIELYYEIEKIKTDCNIKSQSSDVVLLKLERRSR